MANGRNAVQVSRENACRVLRHLVLLNLSKPEDSGCSNGQSSSGSANGAIIIGCGGGNGNGNPTLLQCKCDNHIGSPRAYWPTAMIDISEWRCGLCLIGVPH